METKKLQESMTDKEFDIIDELYFINTFDVLLEETELDEIVLKTELINLVNKGWIKCLARVNQEIAFDENTFEQNYRKYHYLATKKGLLAHNGRS